MRIVLLAIAILAATCCAAQSSSFLNTDKVSELTGKIRKYQPNENNRLFTVRVSSVYGRPQVINVPVNNDGSFTIQFTQPYTGDLLGRFAGTYFSIYFIAGAKETIEIDEKLLLESENETEAVTISGESGAVTRVCQDFKYNFNKQQWKTQVNLEDSSKTDTEISDMFLQQMQEQLAYLQTYTKQKNIANSVFENWAKNNILYTAGYNALFTLQAPSRGRPYTYPDIFYITRSIPVHNPQALYNSMYYVYLNLLAGTMTVTFNFRPIYADLRLQTGRNAIAYVSTLIDSISSGATRQLLYLYLFIHNIAKADYYRQDLEKVVLDNHLKNTYEATWTQVYGSFKEFDLLEKLKAVKADSSVKSRLISLFTAEKNNFVFLDFWGTWCKPCMEEMPFYREYIDLFKDKKITFIFMAADTPEKEALKVKNKYRIKGRFFSMNASELDIMQGLLRITGYPTHMLLKPGSIVTGFNGYKIARDNKLAPEAIKTLASFLSNAQ